MGVGVGDQQHPVLALENSRGGIHEEGKRVVEANSPAVLDTASWDIMALSKQKEKREWNTKNLGQRIAVDAGCAVAAGTMVAPVVSMIDR